MAHPNTEWIPKPNHSTRILLIRHGETDWNKASRYQGHVDIPLNATGLQQAELLRRRFERMAAQIQQPSLFDQCYTSPLERARATAQVLNHNNQPLIANANLKERNYGVLAGLTSTEMQLQFPKEFQSISSRESHAIITHGESLSEFNQRVLSAFHHIIQANLQRTVLLVAHGGVLDCIYRFSLNIPLQIQRSWPIPNGAFNLIDVHPNNQLEIRIWADTTHLHRLNAEKLDELDGRIT